MHHSAVSKTVQRVGHWSLSRSQKEMTGLAMINDSLVMENDTEEVTLMVVTKVELPYVMLRPNKQGNEAFEGFTIDLLKVIVLLHSPINLPYRYVL